MTSYIKSFGNWVLSYLGIWQKKAKVLLIGLDNSGKTSLLHFLKYNKLSCHGPTNHPTSEQVKIFNITFNVFDVGGHNAVRKLWKNYTHGVDCVIFIIDASDVYRIDDVKKELYSFLSDDNIKNIPILILGNKIDINPSFKHNELEQILSIDKNNDKIKLFMCSLFLRINIKQSLEWLSTKII